MPDVVLTVAQPEGRLQPRHASVTAAQAKALQQRIRAAAETVGGGPGHHKVTLEVGRPGLATFVLSRWVAAGWLGELHALLDEAEESADADA